MFLGCKKFVAVRNILIFQFDNAGVFDHCLNVYRDRPGSQSCLVVAIGWERLEIFLSVSQALSDSMNDDAGAGNSGHRMVTYFVH